MLEKEKHAREHKGKMIAKESGENEKKKKKMKNYPKVQSKMMITIREKLTWKMKVKTRRKKDTNKCSKVEMIKELLFLKKKYNEEKLRKD